MEFRFKKTKITTPLDFVQTAFEQMAKDKQINLKFEIEENLEELYIDSSRIEQVLTNLISNAIKFTSENGEITINAKKINCTQINPENLIDQDISKLYDNYILVEVKDTGIGIDEENLKRVFDKFAQIENPLSREVGGTGLGLPIAKQLVQSHLGFIWLKSELGVGTTFSIALPILNDEQIFYVDLNSNIQKAKQEHINVGMIMLEEKEAQKESLIENIKNGNVNVFYKTSTSLDFYKKNFDRRQLIYAINGIDNFALQMIKKKLNNYLDTNEKKFDKCAILFSTALYPDDGLDATELIAKLQSSLKGVNDEQEKNTYS